MEDMRMGEEKYDVIIVGGGLAGLTAAYVLASAGLEVIIIERGGYCGAKNMTGGRLYGHSMEKVIPGFAKDAPIERVITKERLALLTADGALTIDYASDKLNAAPSYSVIRARFDQWLAEKAEAAGAMVVTGIYVDDLVVNEGKVCGIVADGEEMYSDLVLLADGVNSLLGQKLGLKPELTSSQVAVGVKEVIALDEKVINERFGVDGDKGVAMMTLGHITGGSVGGGFLYTNKDSVSIGVVATVSDIGYSEVSVPDMVDRFKEHPAIKPLLAGGTPVEYSAHLVPEGGYDMIPDLYGDGVLLAGDAAGFVINLGYTVRGMDFAVESGRLAAETILKAKGTGDFSAETLSSYKGALENSFIFKEMMKYRNLPAIMESSHSLYEDYPPILDDFMSSLYVVDGSNPTGIINKLTKAVKPVGLVNLANYGVKMMGAM